MAAAEDFLYQEEKRADAAAELRDAAASGHEETIRQAISRARDVGVDGQELSKAEVFLWKENLIKDAHAAIEDALAQHNLFALRSAMAQARVAGMTDEDRILVAQEFLTGGDTLEMLQLRSVFDAWSQSLLAQATEYKTNGTLCEKKHEKQAMTDGHNQNADLELETFRYSEKWSSFAERVCRFDDSIQLLREDLVVAVSSRDANRIRRAVLQAIQNGLEQALINRIVLDVQKNTVQAQSRQTTPLPSENTSRFESSKGLSEDKAATKVQAVYRGRNARLEAAAQRQQRAAREDEEARAALRVQSMYRGRAVREEAKRKRRTEARALRAEVRAVGLVEEEPAPASPTSPGADESAAATRIQARYRGQVARGELQKRRTQKQEKSFAPIAGSAAAIPPTRAIESPADVGSLAMHAVDVGITREDLATAQKICEREELEESAIRAPVRNTTACKDVYQDLSLALQSGDSARVRCAVQAVEAAGTCSREVQVLAAALRGDGSVDPAAIAVAAMSLAGCAQPAQPQRPRARTAGGLGHGPRQLSWLMS
jgi:hypothetical protein